MAPKHTMLVSDPRMDVTGKQVGWKAGTWCTIVLLGVNKSLSSPCVCPHVQDGALGLYCF